MTTEHDGGSLEWTGERYLPDIPGNIRFEHVHRYLLAGELAAGRRVLDIACGEGYGTALLARTAAHVVGVDIVPAVVAHARRRYRQSNLSFAVGSAAAIPLADQSIDLVVSFETLEHLEQHDEMMQDVKRILRPGGLVVVSSPDRQQYSDLPNYQNPFHQRELYREEFERLLQAHFGQSFLVGQRVRAGSVIGPLQPSDRTTFLTFADPDGARSVAERTEGLAAPLYLIGIATDGELPRIPTGLLDGGEFVWLSDQTSAIRQLLDTHRAEIQRYQTQEVAHDATFRALKEELERQGATVVALSTQAGRAEERVAWLEEEMARLRDAGVRSRTLDACQLQATAFDAERSALEKGSRVWQEHARGLEAERSALEKGSRLWQEHARGLEAERERLEQERLQLQTELDAVRQVWDAHEYELAGLRQELDVMRNSQSWRVTAPLRESRRLAGRIGRRVLGPRAPEAPVAPPDDMPDPPPEPPQGLAEAALRVPPAPPPVAPPEPPPIEYVPLTDRDRRGHADQGHRVLPAAVPPDPGERRVVGQGVHRVVERRPRPAAVRRPLSAALARRARVLRSPAGRGAAAPGRVGPHLRAARLLLPPLLVRRHTPVAPAARSAPGQPGPRFSLLPVLGERELDPALGRPGR